MISSLAIDTPWTELPDTSSLSSYGSEEQTVVKITRINCMDSNPDYSINWITTLKSWLLYFSIHDDVIKWKHFSRYWPFVRGIHRSPVNSPYKGRWRGALMFSVICAWINGWVNNRKAGDLRQHRAHYDVIGLKWLQWIWRKLRGKNGPCSVVDVLFGFRFDFHFCEFDHHGRFMGY